VDHEGCFRIKDFVLACGIVEGPVGLFLIVGQHVVPPSELQVAETGHRPEGVGVSRDVGRTKKAHLSRLGGIALISRHCDVLNRTTHSSRFRDALYLTLFDQPVKIEFFHSHLTFNSASFCNTTVLLKNILGLSTLLNPTALARAMVPSIILLET
jgi:hypothetical protein